MPTTTEVEARLRRTAQACEPIVDELLGDPAGPSPIVIDQRQRRGPTRWLAAAALVVAVALAAVVAVASADDPDADVQADGGGAPSSTTAPSAPVAEGVEVLLPDGARLDVVLPDPEQWSPRGTQSVADVEGAAEPILVDTDPGTLDTAIVRVGADPTPDEVAPGVFRVEGDQLTLLVIEREGWTVSLTVASAGRPEADLPEATISALAQGLDATATPLGPVDITAPGLTLQSVSLFLEADADQGPDVSSLTITRDLIDPTTCAAEPGPDERCIDGLEVAAMGPRAVEALPVVEIRELDAAGPIPSTTAPADDAPPATDLVPVEVPLPDGTTARLSVPPSPSWALSDSSAWLELGPRQGDRIIRFTRQTVEEWASERDGDLAVLAGDGAWLATSGPNRWLLVEREGWLAVLGVAGDEALDPDALGQSDEPLDDATVAALGAELSFTATAAGPTDLTGPDVTVTNVMALLRTEPASDDPGDTLVIEVDPLSTDACDGTPNVQNRCFDDDTVRMTGLGSGGQAALAAMTISIED